MGTEAEAKFGRDYNDVWQGPAIVGLTHYFADPDMERRFMSAVAAPNRLRLLSLIGVSVLMPAVGIAINAWLGVHGADAAKVTATRLVEIGLSLMFMAAAARCRTPRALEALSVAFALYFIVIHCVLAAALPIGASSAMVVNAVTLLYFSLPIRLSLLAPLMALATGAMFAAWMRLGPPTLAVVSVAQSVTLVNLLGIAAMRMMRSTLRRQWSQSEALRHLATHDGLTGIANRQFFDQALAGEWDRCLRADAPLSVILLDVDFFKLLNDELGHAAGDSCLRDLAVLLENCVVRASDLVARTGGEEFAVLLSDTGERDACRVAQRIVQAVADAAVAHPCSPIGPRLTVSLGVATAWPARGFAAWELTALADQLVYIAKREGRNTMRQQTLGKSAPSARAPASHAQTGGAQVQAAPEKEPIGP